MKKSENGNNKFSSNADLLAGFYTIAFAIVIIEHKKDPEFTEMSTIFQIGNIALEIIGTMLFVFIAWTIGTAIYNTYKESIENRAWSERRKSWTFWINYLGALSILAWYCITKLGI